MNRRDFLSTILIASVAAPTIISRIGVSKAVAASETYFKLDDVLLVMNATGQGEIKELIVQAIEGEKLLVDYWPPRPYQYIFEDGDEIIQVNRWNVFPSY